MRSLTYYAGPDSGQFCMDADADIAGYGWVLPAAVCAYVRAYLYLCLSVCLCLCLCGDDQYAIARSVTAGRRRRLVQLLSTLILLVINYRTPRRRQYCFCSSRCVDNAVE